MELAKHLILATLTTVLWMSAAHAGEWRGDGEWQSMSGDAIKGRWQATLYQSGDEVSGTITLTGSPLFKDAATVSGTLSGGALILGVVQDGQKVASFGGELNDGRVSGEWESATAVDNGVWVGGLAPVAE